MSEPPTPPESFGPNEWLVDELYEQYLKDKDSVDPAWWDFFADYQPTDYSGLRAAALEAPPVIIDEAGQQITPVEPAQVEPAPTGLTAPAAPVDEAAPPASHVPGPPPPAGVAPGVSDVTIPTPAAPPPAATPPSKSPAATAVNRGKVGWPPASSSWGMRPFSNRRPRQAP